MTTGLRFFYRHIFVTGLENIPSQGPVIIIANHNSSLMDAALLGILLKRRAWFFARGDVFVNKPVQKILGWLHMMPVHSHQGGRNTLQANSNSFSAAQKILSQGGVIVFFPESYSHTEHHLLPFRKGVFRLAFDTAVAKNFSFDIPVVPIGITYDHPTAGGTAASVHAGKPILLSAYQTDYEKSPAVAVLHICKDSWQEMEKLVLHIADQNRLQTADNYCTVSRNNHLPGRAWKVASSEKLAREQAICKEISQAAPDDFEDKKSKTNRYFDALSSASVTDRTASGKRVVSTGKKILLLLGFPIFFIGLMLNGLPVLLARRIADKKVKRKDFYSWIFVVCYSFNYLFWLMIVFAIGALAFNWMYAGGILLVLVASGLFAYVYQNWLHDNRQQAKWKSLSASRIAELQTMRNSL
ncbi:MAG: 1-acyl-sn-glycerol-3-phosphate acyltransferase [Chitinophagaceae bacterium]